MKRFLALLTLFVLVLTGCTAEQKGEEQQQDTPTQPPKEIISDDPIPKEEQEKTKLSEEEAKNLVAETIDAEKYTIELTDDTLSVGSDDKTKHEYFVFEVKDAENASVGQVAIDKETGQKYHYLGDGVLDSYDTFPLYNHSAEAVCDWQGVYNGPAGTTLEVLQGDASSFEYIFSEGKAGNARITGNTAKSTDGGISFLFSDGVITVAGGGMTGNYTIQ